MKRLTSSKEFFKGNCNYMKYPDDYINKILCGDDLEILPQLPAESVNCVVTSPPYWNLRDYSVEGQLGLEKTFEEYITKLCNIFDEVKRVLRKDGTCFVNIGDSYGGSGNASGHTEDTKNLGYKTLEMGATQGNQKTTGQYAKSLLDIPYRFSIEMINRGWIKRNTIIWWKPNCMPSSAPDRFTVDFEYLFFFTKNNKAIFWTNEKTLGCVDKKPPGIKGIEGKDWEWGINSKGDPKKISFWTGHDYWFEQAFENSTESDEKVMTRARANNNFNKNDITGGLSFESKNKYYKRIRNGEIPIGRNKRCVWIIPTQPFPEAHFAVYPEGLIEIPIKAGCPEFVCKKCGKPRVKMLEPTEEYKKFLGKSWHDHKDDSGMGFGQQTRGFSSRKGKVDGIERYKNLGYSDCGCNAGWESGIVLDPFMGAGTTALVALKQRKRFIGIEIKQEYIDMSYKRISNVQQNIF